MSYNINKDKQNVALMYTVTVCSSLPLSHSYFLREILLNAEEMAKLSRLLISLENKLFRKMKT